MELEAVLPSAAHVKIFPSEFNTVEGYIYPQTSKVAAWCNANVSDNETEWDWKPCTEEELGTTVTPEDLWRAFRGGGGGTYGIVTSVKYQLFDQKPFQVVLGGNLASIPGIAEKQAEIRTKIEADETGQLGMALSRMYTMFLVDLLFNPANIGISDEFSLHTGSPELDFRIVGESFIVDLTLTLLLFSLLNNLYHYTKVLDFSCIGAMEIL